MLCELVIRTALTLAFDYNTTYNVILYASSRSRDTSVTILRPQPLRLVLDSHTVGRPNGCFRPPSRARVFADDNLKTFRPSYFPQVRYTRVGHCLECARVRNNDSPVYYIIIIIICI